MRDWAEQHLMRGRASRLVWKLLRNLDRHGVATAASAMAFDAFLSLIPLLAMSGYVLGLLHRRESPLLEPLFRAAPGAVGALAGGEFLRLSDEGAAALAPLSAIAFVWVGSAGMSTAMGVCETIFAAEERPWWKRRAIAIGCVLAAMIGFPVATTLTLALASQLDAAGPFVGFAAGAVTLLGAIVAFYRIALRRRPDVRRRALPGALVTLTLWAVVSALFSLYVQTLARFTTLYGGLATVAILLFWLWLLALALLVGGEVNAELEGVRTGEDDVPLSWRPPRVPHEVPAPPPPPV